MFTATQKKGIVSQAFEAQDEYCKPFDSGEYQKVGAWKVEWVPSEKENFLVQKGLGLVEDCQG